MSDGFYDPFGLPLSMTVSYQELRSTGMTRSDIRQALLDGSLLHARRDVYLSAEVGDDVVRAQRVGGRLDCLSALAHYGVFVERRVGLHVQVEPYDSRLRSPHSRRVPLGGVARDVRVHWRSLEEAERLHTVPLLDAVAQSASCQSPRALVATIDNALHQGLLHEEELTELFARLPPRMRFLRGLIDGRSEAGSESIARLLIRGLGAGVEVQKEIPGVGRVDLLVDGWLVIECDSRAYHGGWEMQERDRERDLALAALGYVCIRPTANLIFQSPEKLLAAVRGLRFGR